MRKYLLPGGGPLDPTAMAQQRIAQLEAELAECKTEIRKRILDYLSLDGQALELMEERDALAAIVQQQKVALERIADTDPDSGTAWFHGVADTALTLDVSQATVILAKRDAEVLRRAADGLNLMVTNGTASISEVCFCEHVLRRVADEREKPCQ